MNQKKKQFFLFSFLGHWLAISFKTQWNREMEETNRPGKGERELEGWKGKEKP